MRWAVLLLAGCAGATLRPTAALTRVPVVAAEGQTEAVLADLARGRPLVVDLFASWCEACRDNLPRMNQLAQRYAAGPVLVVGVDVGEERATARRFVAREGIVYPVYLDPELRFQDSLGVTALPLVVVVDRDGRIAHRSARLDAETVRVIESLAAAPSD